MTRRRLRVAALAALAVSYYVIARPAVAETPITYEVDLRDAASHLVRVTLTAHQAGAQTEIQFPAWNALYQIRDFVRNVQELRAKCGLEPIALLPVNLYTWSIGPRPCSSLTVSYEVYSDEPGVFSSELVPRHAFLNLAEILFYIPGWLGRPARVRFDLPPGWRLVTMLQQNSAQTAYQAGNYNALVDSPVEAGDFRLYSFRRGSAVYRVAVHANAQDYSPRRLLKSIDAVTAAETALMGGMPCPQYTFIFHFPRQGGGGGMEHSCGAAISFPAADLQAGWKNLERTIAHEFFHLWNVKRIRPRGLDAVDYIHPSDTRDLWFSEGVTSGYAEMVLLRARLISRHEFYDHLASA
ncbi:MAG: hypothetical protein ACRD10_13620, partial [Terriglobia bacterium]